MERVTGSTRPSEAPGPPPGSAGTRFLSADTVKHFLVECLAVFVYDHDDERSPTTRSICPHLLAVSFFFFFFFFFFLLSLLWISGLSFLRWVLRAESCRLQVSVMWARAGTFLTARSAAQVAELGDTLDGCLSQGCFNYFSNKQ